MEKLFSCRRDCCPEMMYDAETGNIIITDDFNGKVTLTRVQFETLIKSYKNKFKEEATLDA